MDVTDLPQQGYKILRLQRQPNFSMLIIYSWVMQGTGGENTKGRVLKYRGGLK